MKTKLFFLYLNQSSIFKKMLIFHKLILFFNERQYSSTLKEEPKLGHCEWAKTFDLVVRWQML
jgi:hypothetical protein